MTFLEVIEQVIQRSGRYALVGTYTDGMGTLQPDYTVDAGIRAFVNEAALSLCDAYPWLCSQERRTLTLAQGDQELPVPDLRELDFIEYTASSCWYEVAVKPLRVLKQYYSNYPYPYPYPASQPLSCAFLPYPRTLTAPLLGPNLITLGDFTHANYVFPSEADRFALPLTSTWYNVAVNAAEDSLWGVVSNQAKVTVTAGNTASGLLAQAIAPAALTYGGYLDVALRTCTPVAPTQPYQHNITLGLDDLSLLTFPIGSSSYPLRLTIPATAGRSVISLAVQYRQGAVNDTAIVDGISLQLLTEPLQTNPILWFPTPATQAYDFTVYGSYYQPTLVNDTDQNYLTLKVPYALINYTLAVIARANGNQELYLKMLAAAREDLRQPTLDHHRRVARSYENDTGHLVAKG